MEEILKMARAIAIPKPSGYGARELKEFINKNTVRAFVITFSAILLLAIFFFVQFLFQPKDITNKIFPMTRIEQIDITPQTAEVNDAPPPPPPPANVVVQGGPAARAGTPVPVPDAEITPDMQDFADLDVMDRASAEGGLGDDLGGFSDNIEFSDVDVDVQVREEEPDPDAFMVFDNNVDPDMTAIYEYISYPEVARRAGIEGRVIVRALIDKDGTIKRTQLMKSDNSLFEKPAMDAIKKAEPYTIATQGGRPVQYWVTIPINFKLNQR
jgi:protein TonB